MNQYHIRIDGEQSTDSYTYQKLVDMGLFELDADSLNGIEVKKTTKPNFSPLKSYCFPEWQSNESSYYVDEYGQIYRKNASQSNDHNGAYVDGYGRNVRPNGPSRSWNDKYLIMKYKFYIQMDGETYGPYSAKEVRDLQLMDDILVTEESMNEWLPAGRFDFDDMVIKELEEFVNDDGTINRHPHNVPQNHTIPQQPTHQPSSSVTGGVPDEIKKWNWGAFWFNWLWGVFNGVYWPLALIVVNFIPYIGGLISLGCCIALGVNGSEWAWKAKSWSSVAEFKRVQHKWAIAVIWVFGISIALGILGGILIGIASGL